MKLPYYLKFMNIDKVIKTLNVKKSQHGGGGIFVWLRKVLDKVSYPLGSVIDHHLRGILNDDPENVIENDPKRFFEAFKQAFNMSDDEVFNMLKIVISTIARKFPQEFGEGTELIIKIVDGFKYGDKERVKIFVQIMKRIAEKI